MQTPSVWTRISALVSIGIVPMWLLAVAVSVAFNHYVDENERRHRERIKDLLIKAVDGEVATSLSALQVLASSPLIDDGDLRRWHAQALEVRQAQRALNITLLRPDLQTLVTLDRPFGAPAPRLPIDRLPDVMTQGRPEVSSLFVGAIAPQPLVSLGVPVVRPRGIVGRVEMVYTPERFQALMLQWQRPDGWRACLSDRRGQVIASIDGEPAEGATAARPTACPQADASGTAALSGWTVGVSSEAAPFQRQFWITQTALGVGALILLMAGLLLARRLGRSISDPIQALVAPALAIGRGETATVEPGGLRETQALALALSQAQKLLAHREAATLESRARLDLALEAGGIGHWEVDLKTGDVRASALHDQFFGYPPGSRTWTLDDLDTHLHPSDRDQVAHLREHAVRTGEPWQDEFRVVWPDGSEHWLAARGRCLDEDGQATRMVGVVADITLRRRAFVLNQQRQQLEQENRQLQASITQRERFFANMSHELRTPLSAVIGFAQLLATDEALDDSPRARRYVEHIEDAGRHLLALVGDVLDLAKLEAGRLELAPEPLDTAGLCEKVLAVLRPLADAKGVTLALEADPALPPQTLDPLRLRQILYNLLSNAIKFSANGSTVTLRLAREGDVGVRFEVADQGPGIAEPDQARLFQAYEQLAAGRALGPNGTGLGLALTRQLVELHGGRVSVRGQTGRGSTFVVSLPASMPT